MGSDELNIVSISVVVPVRNELEHFNQILLSISEQTVLPNEILIVDSSSSNDINGLVEKYTGTVPIIYHRKKKSYPGKARNIGVNLSNCEWVAFLDSKTIPEQDWLERYQYLVQAYHADAVFGVTKFDAKTSFQKVLRAATYGKIGHHTVPGTLIKRKVFIDSGGFLEHVRMGEDIEWRERLVKDGFNIHRPEEPVVTYTGLPINFYTTLKKYLTSAYHSARLNILMNIKDVYLSLLLILSAIILPKWNHIIGGWDTNPFFIPHITKIYLMGLVCLFLIYQLVHYLFFRNVSQTLFSRALQLIVLIFVTLAVFNWNDVIAGWMEDAVLYIPHITKIYVGGVLVTSIIYHGLFLPFKRKIGPDYLLPIRWIKVGMLGLSLDLVKAPWYVVGAFLGWITRIQLSFRENSEV